MKYTQLDKNERFLIQKLYNEENKNITEISKILGRNKSTISREIKRNSTVDGYNFEIAERKYIKRSKHKYMFFLNKYDEFIKVFLEKFEKKYHGVAVTYNWIEKNYPNIKKPSLREVYYWIKNKRWTITPASRLRPYYIKGRKRKVGIFSKFKDKFILPIWVRPKKVDLREEFGHWEADFIVGKKANGFANLITLTERKTRKTFVTKILTKNPAKTVSAVYKMIKDNALKVKSITIDNGIEFENFGLLAKWLNIQIYRCEPYASFQRGSNENWNGLIRRSYKKGTDFNLVTDQEILEIQEKINSMPRKKFNWESSNSLYLKEII